MPFYDKYFFTHSEDRVTLGSDLSAEVGEHTDGAEQLVLPSPHPAFNKALNPGGLGAKPPSQIDIIPFFSLFSIVQAGSSSDLIQESRYDVLNDQ